MHVQKEEKEEEDEDEEKTRQDKTKQDKTRRASIYRQHGSPSEAGQFLLDSASPLQGTHHTPCEPKTPTPEFTTVFTTEMQRQFKCPLTDHWTNTSTQEQLYP